MRRQTETRLKGSADTRGPRVTVWVLLAAKVWAAFGVLWDIYWHVLVGRDSPWIAPHLMTYSAVITALAICLLTIGGETVRGWRGTASPSSIRIFGLRGSSSMHLFWWGLVVLLLAVPIDEIWHRLVGVDFTVWSPPHLLGVLGNQVNTLGCLGLALEAYPAGTRGGFFALLLGGALFFSGFHFLLSTSILWTYAYGGITFFLYPILGALLLPVALVPMAGLAASRWAPALAVIVATVVSLVGGAVAQVGFAVLQPEIQIEEAIARDPNSYVATGHRIAQESGVSLVSYTRGPLLILITALPAALLGLAEPRRRPIGASLVFAVTYLAMTGFGLAQVPALQARLPSVAETLAGVMLTLIAAVLGGVAGARVASVVGDHHSVRRRHSDRRPSRPPRLG